MRWLYYLIHWTWGIVENIIGSILLIIFLCTGAKISKYRNAIQVQTKFNWGGSFEMGMFFFLGKNCQSTIPHEYGHTIQVLWWGPLFLFVIALPSAIRYWYREIIYKTDKEKYYNLPEYDAIWFEGQASDIGKRASNNEWSWL